MEYTLDEKYKLIKEEVLKSSSKNPVEIAKSIMHKDFVNIHGPEHHFLDGASFLVAFKNAGGEVDVSEAIDTLAERTIKCLELCADIGAFVDQQLQLELFLPLFMKLVRYHRTIIIKTICNSHHQ